MDPVETINIYTDSTFVLGLEAQKRGYTLFYYTPSMLALENGKVTAQVFPLELRREKGNHFALGPAETMDLAADVDVVLMRQDPPFDMAYITATHILDHLAGQTLVVNNPTGVRNAPEKLLVTHFPHLAPPTLITSDALRVKEFHRQYKDIILKPLYGNGGAQVFHIDESGRNLNALLEMFGDYYREPIIAQKYLPEARNGDKRIILVDGAPVGAILRIPASGETRANLHVGGTAQKTGLTPREVEICKTIGPVLYEQGLLFAGIDVIGDYLTEINVTSPTGLQEINALNDDCLEAKIWDAIEKRLAA